MRQLEKSRSNTYQISPAKRVHFDAESDTDFKPLIMVLHPLWLLSFHQPATEYPFSSYSAQKVDFEGAIQYRQYHKARRSETR